MRSEADFLVDVLRRVNQTALAYMLTGSMASNYWGVPRTTHGLDFVLLMFPEAVDRLIGAFAGGFFFQPEFIRAAFQPPRHFNLDEQSALKADFWLLGDDPFEQTAFGRRIQTELFGAPVWIASPEDVILHKLYWNRLTPSDRQLADAAGVYAVQVDQLDLVYLRQWATYLQVHRELEDLLAGTNRPKMT